MSAAFYSQFGEDRILNDLFQGKSDGVCVEVGANDGVYGSTSLFFEERGWKCLLVEPNPQLCAEIRARRSAILFEGAASNRTDTLTLYIAEGAWRADGMSTASGRAEDLARIAAQGFTSRPVQVRAATLDTILAESLAGQRIDFVTIDVEGLEGEVIEGFSLARWKPTVVIVEDNSGGTNPATARQLARSGYVRFLRTGVNDWYAHKDNEQLVTAGSRMRMARVLFVLRMKAVLKRVPLLVKIGRALHSRKASA